MVIQIKLFQSLNSEQWFFIPGLVIPLSLVSLQANSKEVKYDDIRNRNPDR